MSTGSIVIVAVIVLVLLGGLLILTTATRRDRSAAEGFLSRETRRRDRANPAIEELEGEQAPVSGRAVERMALAGRDGGTALATVTHAPPAVPEFLDDEILGVTRRQFFNRGIVTLMVLSLSGFGASTIAFLWPTLKAGGFGSKIPAGSLDDVLSKANTTKAPVYFPEGRFYINPYPTDAGTMAKASKIYSGAVLEGMKSGVVALYQKCVHLGCRVPWCQSSQWFECPCHGSKYNRVGEKKGGPAPRGLDRFGIAVSGGQLTVDTSPAGLVLGPPIGTDTSGQGQDGPHCA